MIDRYLLRYFLAVIDCGSFSKAARQLNVAQPSLSIGIRKLERMLGSPVFLRTSKRVQITEAGTRLAVHARRIETEFNLALAAVANLQPARSLRLGLLATFPIARLAAAIAAAAAGRNGGRDRLQVVTGSERELLQRLGRGQLDVALTIVRQDHGRNAAEALFTEPYALALPARHPLAARASIAAEDLVDDTMIVRRHCEVLSQTSRHFTERGVRPFFAFRGTNDEQVMELVRAGLGITVMPASFAMKGVVRPLLAGFSLKRQIGLLYAPHAEHQRHAAQPVLEALRAQTTDGPKVR